MSLYHKFRSFTPPWVWEQIHVDPASPLPTSSRGFPLFTRDGDAGDFVLVGGRGTGSTHLSDVWTFNISTRLWTEVSASGLVGCHHPVGFASGGFVYVGSNEDASWTTSSANPPRKVDILTGIATALTYTGTAGPAGATTLGVDGFDLFASPGETSPIGAMTRAAIGATILQDPLGGSATATRYARSSTAKRPTTGVHYMFAPTLASSTGAWVLSASDIVTRTAGTSWAVETGVTNNAGPIELQAAVIDPRGNHLVWSSVESKFFLFISGAASRVFTYDPATKTIDQLPIRDMPSRDLFGGHPNVGNAGAVVVSPEGFYGCATRQPLTSGTIPDTSIWRFRRA